MEVLNMEYLWVLAVIPVAFGVWFRWGRRSHTLKNTQVSRVRVSTAFGVTLTALIWASKIALFASLTLALSGTYFAFNRIGTDAAGIIYMTIDTSGSTKTGGLSFDYEKTLAIHFDPGFDPEKQKKQAPPNPGHYIMDQKAVPADAPRIPNPIDAELGAAKMFIEHSLGLRIGVTVFDDKFFYVYPATKNQEVAINVLQDVKYYSDNWTTGATGTNFDGPFTGRPYDGALQGALNVFRKEASNPTRIYIMITDGIASIDESRAKTLAEAYKELGIHFFVFGVDSQWSNLETANLKPLIDFTKAVNGTVVSVQDEKQFKAALTKIEDLARASIRTVYIKERQDALLLLLGIAVISFFAWIALSAIRRSIL